MSRSQRGARRKSMGEGTPSEIRTASGERETTQRRRWGKQKGKMMEEQKREEGQGGYLFHGDTMDEREITINIHITI